MRKQSPKSKPNVRVTTRSATSDASVSRDVALQKLELLACLVPKLARAFAPICEVVLHENATFPPTIKAIGNGHVSGRKVGDSMTWNCQIFVEGEKIANRKTPLFNYIAQSPNGHRIRASLIPILHDDEVIAYITVSVLTEDLAMARQAISLLLEPDPKEEGESSFISPRDLLVKVIDSHLQKTSRPIALWDRKQRIALISELKEKGVFNTRGAVDEVAALLSVSRTAVYNYINVASERAVRETSAESL